MAKRYVCEACNKGCKFGVVHICDQTGSDCMASPPCVSAGIQIPCELCNRNFRSQACFYMYKKTQGKNKSVCELRKCLIRAALRSPIRSTNVISCSVTCNENKEVGHVSFMRPLINVSASSEHVLYVFYDFETTQDTKRSDKTNVHVSNLVCLQQLCSKCENILDIKQDCIMCGKRKHSFSDDPVGNMLSYLCESQPWVEKIIEIAHNPKAFELHFILSRAILMKCQVELIMNGMKIMCTRAEHLVFLDISFLPFALCKQPEAIGLLPILVSAIF